jgi:hypothetical protein
MLRLFTMICALSALAACGGARGYNPSGGYGGGAVLFATGPLNSACLAAGRKQASRARCGCIQAVADRELSAADQRRGVRVFRASDNAFWAAWKAYGNTAQTLCSAA